MNEAIALFRILEQLEDLAGRPDIGKTITSRTSDRLIDGMSTALKPFITAYMAKGFFTNDQLQQLSNIFQQHAQDQYFLGRDYAHSVTDDVKPISHADLLNVQTLARSAQQDFINSLAKQRIKIHQNDIATSAGVIAGLAAVTLGIRALNRGTTSRAETVEYVTRRDSKVCPICEQYDGQLYDVDEHSGLPKGGPVIPDDTHPNCRCRYIVRS